MRRRRFQFDKESPEIPAYVIRESPTSLIAKLLNVLSRRRLAGSSTLSGTANFQSEELNFQF